MFYVSPPSAAFKLLDELVDALRQGNQPDEAASLAGVQRRWLDHVRAEQHQPLDRRSIAARAILAGVTQ